MWIGITRMVATTFFFVIDTSLTPSARGMPLFSTQGAASRPVPSARVGIFFLAEAITHHPSRVLKEGDYPWPQRQ
jgi:hypothetical protein